MTDPTTSITGWRHDAPGSPRSGTFFGHPKGLKTLFFTEMWERFSYYGMRAFLTLYAVAAASVGGLGMTKAEAGIIYGCYGSLVYLLSVPGGWIADRILGQRRAVMLGGFLIMCGHLTLTVSALAAFYGGLGLIILGTGLLKPNISAMVGQLYPRGADARRAAGYTIYYMGINIGALVAPLVCGFLAQSDQFRGWLDGRGIDPNLSWHVGFGAAAVGMGFGLIQFWRGSRHLPEGVGAAPAPPADPRARARDNRILVAILGGLAAISTLLVILFVGVEISATKEDVADVFGLVLGVVAIVVLTRMLRAAANPDERRRVIAMIVLFIGCLGFFAVFEQAGSTLNFFASEHTAKELLGFRFPPSWFQSVNSAWVITLGPVFAWLWLRLAARGREPSDVAKFAIGMVLTALSFLVMLPTLAPIEAGHQVSPGWLIALYFFSTAGELCISPVGLSSMSKLSPPRLSGLVMGVWFLAIAIGNYLAGRAAEVTEVHGTRTLFWLLIGFSLSIAGVLWLLAGRGARRR